MAMLKATEIKLLTTKNPEALQSVINTHLKDGWTLHGDLKIFIVNNEQNFMQPMVKLEMFEPGGSLGLGGGMPPILIPRGG